jgi:cytochrome b561
MFVIPTSGWIAASASPLAIPIRFLNLFNVPNLASTDPFVYATAAQCHLVLALIFLCLVILHMAAAFGHHFVKRDDVLSRMIRGSVASTSQDEN